jgi:hypothetical protein
MNERQESDPRNRKELEEWLRWREREFPGEALSAREYLMVQRVRSSRPAYSKT